MSVIDVQHLLSYSQLAVPGKCLDEYGSDYNYTRVTLTGSSPEYCAATCQSFGNNGNHVGFQYKAAPITEESDCDCLYTNGQKVITQ